MHIESDTITAKQELAHRLILEHASETYDDLAKICGVSKNVVCRIFHTKTGENYSRDYYVLKEETLDKIIAGLS